MYKEGEAAVGPSSKAIVHSPSGASVISSGPLHLEIVQLHVFLLLPTLLLVYTTFPLAVSVETGMSGILPADTAALRALIHSCGREESGGVARAAGYLLLAPLLVKRTRWLLSRVAETQDRAAKVIVSACTAKRTIVCTEVFQFKERKKEREGSDQREMDMAPLYIYIDRWIDEERQTFHSIDA